VVFQTENHFQNGLSVDFANKIIAGAFNWPSGGDFPAKGVKCFSVSGLLACDCDYLMNYQLHTFCLPPGSHPNGVRIQGERLQRRKWDWMPWGEALIAV
jgi:hypothetical protein